MSNVIQLLAEQLHSGKPTLGTWSTLADPEAVTLLMQEDFATVVLDLQHGSMDYRAAATAIGLIASIDKPAIARVPVADYGLASRLADAGAAAIIAPMINSADDAKKLVAATKYPPIGERSWGPNTVEKYTDLYGPDYFFAANKFTLCFAMFETQSAFDHMDEILSVEGLDGVFVGPADLSIGLSAGKILDPLHKSVDEALAILFNKTREYNKYMAAFAPTPARAAEHLQAGYELVTLVGDALFLKTGAKAAYSEVSRLLAN